MQESFYWCIHVFYRWQVHREGLAEWIWQRHYLGHVAKSLVFSEGDHHEDHSHQQNLFCYWIPVYRCQAVWRPGRHLKTSPKLPQLFWAITVFGNDMSKAFSRECKHPSVSFLVFSILYILILKRKTLYISHTGRFLQLDQLIQTSHCQWINKIPCLL